jgi:hypothetical protein
MTHADFTLLSHAEFSHLDHAEVSQLDHAESTLLGHASWDAELTHTKWVEKSISCIMIDSAPAHWGLLLQCAAIL